MATATKNVQKSDNSNRSQNQGSRSNENQDSRSNDRQHHMMQDAVDYVREYARERPEAAALWCLGIGFILGWKLKPW